MMLESVEFDKELYQDAYAFLLKIENITRQSSRLVTLAADVGVLPKK